MQCDTKRVSEVGVPERDENERIVSVPMGDDWGVPLVIAIAIVISMAAFILIFVRLEPYMSDFIANDAVASPIVTGSPTVASP
jgi:hypothetical protein